MTDKIDTSTHQQVFELLPWYVNGTLAEAERAAVQRHLTECLVCRRELDAQRSLQEMFEHSETVPLAPRQGLSTLMAKIDSQARPESGFMIRLRPLASHWRIAAAVAVLAIGAVAAVSLSVRDERREPLFRTLSSDNGVVVEDDAPLLQVIFEDSVAEADARSILSGLRGRVIAGPSDTAAYTIEVDPSEVALSLETLRADPRVRFAEHARVLSARE